MDKKIKMGNLKESDHYPLFEDAVFAFGMSGLENVAQLTKKERETTRFWLEAHYKIHPENDLYGMAYGSFLSQIGHIQDAFAVVHELAKKLDAASSNYPLYCSDICTIYTAAEKNFDEALEFALKMPAGHFRALICLRHFCETCAQIAQKDYGNKHPGLPQVLLKASRVLVERDPDDVDSKQRFAAALSLGGKPLEGVKLYRQLLASGKLTEEHVKHVELGLISAQLKCPRMLLENLSIVTATEENTFVCVKEEDRKHLVKHPMGLRINGSQTVNVQHFRIPRSPDDPEFFPESFLRQFQ